VAQLSIHPIMSTERNTVVLLNAALGALGALVVLAVFECSGFISARFRINGVFCKESRSNTLRTSRVHGPCPCTRPAHGRVHGPYTRVHGRVGRQLDGRPTRAYMYTAVSRPCTRHLHGRVHGPYAALYTSTRPCTRADTARTGPCTGCVHGRYTAVYGHFTRPKTCTRCLYVCTCTCSCTRPRTRLVVYMAGRCTRPWAWAKTARYGRVRFVTAVARPAHGRVYGQPCIRMAVYTAVYAPCT